MRHAILSLAALPLLACSALYPKVARVPNTDSAPTSNNADASTSDGTTTAATSDEDETNTLAFNLTDGVSDIQVGTCIELNLEYSYAGGTSPTVGAGPGLTEPLLLTTSSPDGHFYSDNACSDELHPGLVDIVLGSEFSYSTWYSDTLSSGVITLTSTDAGTLGLPTQAVSLTVEVPTTVQLSNSNWSSISQISAQFGGDPTSSPWPLPVSTCAEIDFNAADSDGNFMQIADDVNLSLSVSGAGGNFYANVTCTQPITTVTLSSNPITPTFFYFEATTSGLRTVTLTPTGGTTLKPGSVAISVSSGT